MDAAVDGLLIVHFEDVHKSLDIVEAVHGCYAKLKMMMVYTLLCNRIL